MTNVNTNKLSAALSLVATSFVVATTTASSICPDQELLRFSWQYHDDAVCDRRAFNDVHIQQRRDAIYNYYKQAGGVSAVPNQMTLYCPAQLDDIQPSVPALGFGTVWLVENLASVPVVISFLKSDGVEGSARNPYIVPPEKDPESILPPGSWMSISTFEGHVFQARELLPDGSAGRVMMQHRVGLVPVGGNAAGLGTATDCSAMDAFPSYTEPLSDANESNERPCNAIDVGFRNMAGCSLDAFLVETNENGQCEERFKFHMGVESNVQDFMNDWKSQTKYEGTVVGQTFSFRLSAYPSVVVDTVTIEPTLIYDCSSTSTTTKQTTAIRPEMSPHGVESHSSDETSSSTSVDRHLYNRIVSSIDIYRDLIYNETLASVAARSPQAPSFKSTVMLLSPLVTVTQGNRNYTVFSSPLGSKQGAKTLSI